MKKEINLDDLYFYKGKFRTEEGLKRAFDRGTTNRMEDMDMSFHHNLRKAFLDIARQEPDRCVVLDARKSPDALHEEIITVLRKRFL